MLEGPVSRSKAQRTRSTPSYSTSRPGEWTSKLHDEQSEALDFVCSRSGTLLLGDVGTGKTYITLAAIERLRPRLCLIIAPLTSLDITWGPKLRTMPGVRLLRTLDDLRLYAKRQAATSEALSGVLLMHYQAASPLMQKLGKIDWDLVVFDEAQGLKARQSGWSRLARYLRHAERRLALTATPIDGSPIDLWGQMRFVDFTVFGEAFKNFAGEFCRKGGYMGYEWQFIQSKLPQFLDRLKNHIFRLNQQFLDLPPLTVHLIGTDLLGSQRRFYDEMDTHGITKDPEVVAQLEVVKQGKLEQITGGLVLSEKKKFHVVGFAKARKLSAIIPKLKRPLVVSCKYLHEIPLIAAILELTMPNKVALLYGKVKGQTRTKLINDFQAGKIDGLVLQVRTGGVSIEFTRSCTLVMYSMNFSLIDFEQLIGRFHRGGQTEPVEVFVIYAKKTVDMKIIHDIRQKHSDFYQVVEYFETRR